MWLDRMALPRDILDSSVTIVSIAFHNWQEREYLMTTNT